MTTNYVQSCEQDFNRAKRELLSVLSSLRKLAPDESWGDRTDAAAVRLRAEQASVLVVGEFSRGKSTFINALLGAPVLPSKVNPTTATINVIRWGEPSLATIRYRDGKEESLDLPETGVNKLLDSVVTTANDNASRIETVTIQWPRTPTFDGIIVDTPGVNDLVEAREEITYGYLSNADACIVILDSQQPLSASERSFVVNKVLGKDVSRFLFVVNRADEVSKNASEPDVATMERIGGYVRGLIETNIPGVTTPSVHVVAAKPALAARFKGARSPWLDVFTDFEQVLAKFTSAMAVERRMPDHIGRARAIAGDMAKSLADSISLLSDSQDGSEAALKSLEVEEKYLAAKSATTSAIIAEAKVSLASQIARKTTDGFQELRTTLMASAEKCACDDDISRLRSAASVGIRKVVEGIEETVSAWRIETIKKLKDDLGEDGAGVLEDHRLVVRSPNLPTGSSGTSFAGFSGSSFDPSSYGVTLLSSGALGYVAASLFGPIGIVGAIVGGALIGKSVDEDRQKQAWEAFRQKTLFKIRGELDNVIGTAEQSAQEIAKKEAEATLSHIRSRIEGRNSSIAASFAERHALAESDRAALDTRREELGARLKAAREIVGRLDRLQEG